ncbi:hypothetical protein LTR50_006022 [Elasticomyces elasticus]|nr:hypothetical protein LTR50_006022 [Elasticomyces elasticus]
MASLSSGGANTKLSFAKVAASACLPPPPRHETNTTTNTTNRQEPTSPSPVGNGMVVGATQEQRNVQSSAMKTPKLVQLSPREAAIPQISRLTRPTASARGAETSTKSTEDVLPADAAQRLAVNEENGTLLSLSDGSGKPSSLDGKSVASGTTFALDEKESLRPDDSASVKAVEEDDLFSPPGSATADSRIGSDTGARAFRDQLREIQSMGVPVARRVGASTRFAPPANTPGASLYNPPPVVIAGQLPPQESAQNGTACDNVDPRPDEKLLEALESPRDRLFVLKLEQDIIDFVKDSKEHSLELPQCNSFYRMLAHKLADYYLLGHAVDGSMSSVHLFKTADCRISAPLTGITNPSTAASTPPPVIPARKILRREASKATSEADGDSGNDDQKSKALMSREEREAKYKEARLRILGSAEVTDSPPEKEDSRPSSGAGKKKSKRHRKDSDDGFEARSAYGPLYAPTYAPKTLTNATPDTTYYDSYGNTPAMPQFYGSDGYAAPDQDQGYSAMMQQETFEYSWPAQAYETNGPIAGYTSPDGFQQTGYDLSNDFQRAVSFQSPNVVSQTSPVIMASPADNYSGGYQAQVAENGQAWFLPPAQNHYQLSQNTFSQPQMNYSNHSVSSSVQSTQNLYPYGQLPTPSYIGATQYRNPQHPIPGSFNRQQFNPQSQSFVPGRTGSNNRHAFPPQMGSPQRQMNAQPGSSPMQRQTSAQSHASAYGSPHPSQLNSTAQRTNGHGMTHPLPQPVFTQPPAVPLPQRPQNYVTRSMAPPQTVSIPQNTQSFLPARGNNQSSIAKWGTPASLPKKPPPPAEPVDALSFNSSQRSVPTFNPSSHTRLPTNGLASYGTPSPMTQANGRGGSATQPGHRGQ